MFRHNPAEGHLTHLNNCTSYYENSKEKIILEELHKLWKHHTAHLKELHQKNENSTGQNPNNSTKFEIGQPVMVKNHTCHIFKPKYLLDYKVLKINASTLLLIILNGKE